MHSISPPSATENGISSTDQLNNSNRIESTNNPADCHPRLIKEYLDELELVPEPSEFQKLNDLDQQLHVMQFEDEEGRYWLENTAEGRMNR